MKKLTLLSLFTFILCLLNQTSVYGESEFDGATIGISLGGSIEPIRNIGFRQASFSSPNGTLAFPHKESWDVKRQPAFAISPSIGYGLSFGKFYIGHEFSIVVVRKRDRMTKNTNLTFLPANFSHDTSVDLFLRDTEPCFDLKLGYILNENLLVSYKIGTSKNKMRARVVSKARLTNDDDDFSTNYNKSFVKNIYSLRTGIEIEYKLSKLIGIKLSNMYVSHGKIKVNGCSNFVGGPGFKMSHTNILRFRHSLTMIGANIYFM